MGLSGPVLAAAREQAAQLFDLVGPIGLGDARFLLLLHQFDLLWRDIAPFVQHQAAGGHHFVAVHPLAVFLAEAQGRAGLRVIGVEFQDALQVALRFGLQPVVAAPFDELPMGFDCICD